MGYNGGMCGLLGYVGGSSVSGKIARGLVYLQHRGQDSAGIATVSGTRVHMEKGFGLVEDVFNDFKLNALRGEMGIGHVRYTTSGDPFELSSIQPFYVNHPYGMTLVHNGNLTNHKALCADLTARARRHISSDSDSELLLNTLAHALDERSRGRRLTPSALFDAVAEVHKRCEGAYSVLALIAGVGMLAFRDPHGVRPLVFGGKSDGSNEWLFASENVAFHSLGFHRWDNVRPGEAILVDTEGKISRRQCAAKKVAHIPCIFEYIYLARPDSTIDDVSVYEVRLRMGAQLARRIMRDYARLKIDSVIPVPESGRVAAMELAHELGVPYREGLVKNRYIGRTFIEPGQTKRIQSVRKKLNAIDAEFFGKRVLLVDDSIVRGTTSRDLVRLSRKAGAKKVYFASAAPPVRFPNVYGIDIPTRAELVGGSRSEREIAAYLGADAVIYQSLDDLVGAVRAVNPALRKLETSCFDGHYPIGDISEEYLAALEAERGGGGELAQKQIII